MPKKKRKEVRGAARDLRQNGIERQNRNGEERMRFNLVNLDRSRDID